MSGRISWSLATIVTLASLTLSLVGCRSTPVEQAAPPVSRIGADSPRASLLESGRVIYTGQCARCHRPKPVRDYTEDDWTGRILPKMAKKAKLSTGETESVLAYIIAARGVEVVTEPSH